MIRTPTAGSAPAWADSVHGTGPGTGTLIALTNVITTTGHEETVDGVRMTFQRAPDTVQHKCRVRSNPGAAA